MDINENVHKSCTWLRTHKFNPMHPIFVAIAVAIEPCEQMVIGTEEKIFIVFKSTKQCYKRSSFYPK